MSFTHLLDKAFALLSPFLFGAALVTWIVGIVAEIKLRRATDMPKTFSARRIPFITLIVFIGIIALMFLVSSIIKREAQKEVMQLLTAEIKSVQVNGTAILYFQDFITELRNMDDSLSRYHHTHPTRVFKVVLETTKGTLNLNLARDSGNPNEYWVFYPGYQSTTSNDIGKILTLTFAKD